MAEALFKNESFRHLRFLKGASLWTRDGRISDPAIRIRPDFHYLVKSGSGRIARGTPDRIFASYNTRHSLRMMSLRS